MNTHHDYGNSYKGKHFIGAGLQFQRFNPLSSWVSMTAYRQTWCWRCWEFYMLIRSELETGFPLHWVNPEHRPQGLPPHCHKSFKSTNFSKRTHLLIVSLRGISICKLSCLASCWYECFDETLVYGFWCCDGPLMPFVIIAFKEMAFR